MLHSLYLFKNVKITPDYSVVHDLTPEAWKTYLIGDGETPGEGDLVWSGNVNYYRLPDVIRIEGNYDDIRKATYGAIVDSGSPDPGRPMFFWIGDVRLLKQGALLEGEGQDVICRDVVELDISVDVWSSNNGDFTLYDSYVERRHMNRWTTEGQGGSLRHVPAYYPNAAQGVEGAYELEASEDLTEPVSFQGLNRTFDPRYIIVSALNTDGEVKIFVGVDVKVSDDTYVPVYHTYNSIEIFGVEDLLDGTFYAKTGLEANMVQSITVMPYLSGLTECLRLGFTAGVHYLYFDDSSPIFTYAFSLGSNNGLGYVTLNFGVSRLAGMMEHHYATPTVIGPDYDAAAEGQYIDEHEPMMYMSPARVRKCVTAFGGEVFTVPDIAAFRGTYTLQNIFDLNGAITYVFAGSDVQEANAIGAMGVLDAATLPIFNSAWRSYEAISKVGDEISYNAKQLQTVGGGVSGTILGGVGGFMMGGPVGAALGVAGGITSTVLGAVGNEEELRAKQTTVRNSPCVVKSGGSGLGAYVKGLTDVFYITLRLDPKSMDKLRFMYYWYGYHVNRMFKGTVLMRTRKMFDFIKTNGAKVKGDLTSGASREISSIFDKGVTIYHGTQGYETIGDGIMHDNDEV